MDRTYSVHCPKSENHLYFKVADGPDHSLGCPKNENHLGFKVADGQTIVCIALIMKIIYTFFLRNQLIRNLMQQIWKPLRLTSSEELPPKNLTTYEIFFTDFLVFII